MNIDNKTEIIIRENLVPILSGVTIFMLTFTIFWPTIQNVIKLKQENNQNQKRLVILTEKSKTLADLSQGDLDQQTKKVEEVLPSEKPILNLISSLTRLASVEGVSFSGIQLNPGKINPKTNQKETVPLPEPVVESPVGLQEFIINFTISGKLSNLISYISHLEKTAPLVKLVSLGLSIEGGQASLGVKVYYQALPSTLGKIDKPLTLLTDKEKQVLADVATYQAGEPIKENAKTGRTNLFSLQPE